MLVFNADTSGQVSLMNTTTSQREEDRVRPFFPASFLEAWGLDFYVIQITIPK